MSKLDVSPFKGQYILDGRKPVAVDSKTWVECLVTGSPSRRVAADQVAGCLVSTVFVGLDFGGGADKGLPILFETMVFGGPLDGKQMRCATWEQAEAQHKAVCEEIRRIAETGSQQ